MLAEAAGLAVLAAISPTALLLAAVYLGSARPRTTILLYLTGALLMSVLMGIVVLIALRAGGFSRPSRHMIRHELRIALGIMLLALGYLVLRRKPRPADPSQPQRGMVARLVANPGPYTAFLAGVVIFAPSVTFIAAVQVVATAPVDLTLTAAGLAVITVINVSFIWLPLLGYLAWPAATTRRLAAFNALLRRNGRKIVALALMAAGVILAIDGIAGLIGKS